MNKNLINVPLTELRSSDEEVLGSIYSKDGKSYRWVKNAGSTALIAAGACLARLTSVVANQFKRVISNDGAGTSTGAVSLPAGSPITAIQESGSSTGDHGWIQVAGPKKVSIQQLTTAQTVGMRCIATSSYPATYSFAGGQAETANSATTGYFYRKCVQLLQPIATTGAATAVSCVVDIQCL